MPYHHAKCTPAQKEAVKQAASIAGMEQAQFIRMLCEGGCAAFGVVYPQNLPERGKHDRRKIDWKKIAGMDE
jgi:hypothetical protein